VTYGARSSVAELATRPVAVTAAAIAVGLCTLWVFPGLAYVSVATYGVPASAFILLGYAAWRLLAHRKPIAAEPFLWAFATPIALVLVTMVVSVPLVVVGIVAPVALIELRRRSSRNARARLNSYTGGTQ